MEEKEKTEKEKAADFEGKEEFLCLGCGGIFSVSEAESYWLTMGGSCHGYCKNCGRPF